MADLSFTAANVIAKAGAWIERGTAGDAITAGQVVIRAETGLLILADTNVAGLKSARGIALNQADPGQPLAIIRRGDLAMGEVLVAGTVYFSSETPGGIQLVDDIADIGPEDVILLGVAKSSTILSVNIQIPGVTQTGLAAFAFEPEAEDFFNTVVTSGATPLTDREKYHYNKWYVRGKANGWYPLVTAAWMTYSTDKRISFINLITPGIRDITEVGTTTLSLTGGGISGVSGSNAQYLNTHTPANIVNNDDCHFAVMTINDAGGIFGESFSMGGSIDASSNGFSLVPGVGAGAPTGISARCASALVINFGGATTQGRGMTMVTRDNAETFNCYRSGEWITGAGIAAPATTLGAGDIYLLSSNNNGVATNNATRRLQYASVGRYMTLEQHTDYYAACKSLWEAIRYGHIDYREPGFAPTSVNVDVVVYGFTSGAVLAAYEARRQGLTVALVGGWRDHLGNVGGMMAGGLGKSDWNNDAAGLGGLSRYVTRRIRNLSGGTTNLFQPRFAKYVFMAMLDPARTDGQDVTAYGTGGVISVQKSGTRIKSIRTADGRRFVGKYFIDSSYEGDLMARAGVTYAIGREAAGSGAEVINGYRGLLTAAGSDNHQYRTAADVQLTVDPFVTPTVQASGLIAGVHAILDGSEPANGTGDVCTYINGVLQTGAGTPNTQAYNFRLSLSAALTVGVKMPSIAPTGYVAADYEALARYHAAATAAGDPLAFSETLIPSDVGGETLDINASRGFSTDKWKANWLYPEATYAERETIWKTIETHIRGFFYKCQFGRTVELDTRIPAAVETSANLYFFNSLHHLDPYPGDAVFWPPQLYVREARRMVSDVVWNASDLVATDGTTPRSIKTIAVASYQMDSHHMQGLADHSTGTWRIWNEGNVEDATSGAANDIAPIPYDIIIPKAAECTNLLVTFSLSATHVAFGSLRMEFTHMMTGQAAAHAANVALANANQDVQDVDYTTLRANLLASNVNTFGGLVTETDPVLPQVN